MPASRQRLALLMLRSKARPTAAWLPHQARSAWLLSDHQQRRLRHKKRYFMSKPHRRNSPVVSRKSQKNTNSESAFLEQLLSEVMEKTSPQAIEALLVEIRKMEANLLLEMHMTT